MYEHLHKWFQNSGQAWIVNVTVCTYVIQPKYQHLLHHFVILLPVTLPPCIGKCEISAGMQILYYVHR